MSAPRLIERQGLTLLVTDCCVHAHGKVQDGKLYMKSPHEKRKPHPVEFTPDDLERIAAEIRELERRNVG